MAAELADLDRLRSGCRSHAARPTKGRSDARRFPAVGAGAVQTERHQDLPWRDCSIPLVTRAASRPGRRRRSVDSVQKQKNSKLTDLLDRTLSAAPMGAIVVKRAWRSGPVTCVFSSGLGA